jgi:hypothetical protein
LKAKSLFCFGIFRQTNGTQAFHKPRGHNQTGTIAVAGRIVVTGGFAEVSDRGLTVLAESAGEGAA